MMSFNYSDYYNRVASKLDSVPVEEWQDYPFGHIVIDNFLLEDMANFLYEEVQLLDKSNSQWNNYDNALEVKLTFNHWDRLPANIYSFLSVLGNPTITTLVEELSGISGLVPDVGLHGGGVHLHRRGGKLNVHQDYSLHPKTGLQRRVNIIYYLGKDWVTSWGGGLGIHSHNPETNRPQDLIKVVDYTWNRAIIFDTASNSWHGLPDPIQCPEDRTRASLAYYYTANSLHNDLTHKAVLFAPSELQKNNEEVEKLIALRSNPITARQIYKE